MSTLAADILDARIIERLSHVGVPGPALVAGALTGVHRSPHHGSSVEFAEHHDYSPGDEVRRIDWKVVARTDKYYVRRFEDETNQRTVFVVDASGSMGYGHGDERKWRYAQRLAAHLSYLLLHQQDAVGLVIAGAAGPHYLGPRAHSSQLSEIVDALRAVEPGGPTALHAALLRVAELTPKGASVHVISDLFVNESDLFRGLRQLRARRHDVRLFQVLHADELHFPFERLSDFRDPEGPHHLVIEPGAVRQPYLDALAAFIDRVHRAAGMAGIEHRVVDTTSPLEALLIDYLGAHRVRKGRPTGAV